MSTLDEKAAKRPTREEVLKLIGYIERRRGEWTTITILSDEAVRIARAYLAALDAFDGKDGT